MTVSRRLCTPGRGDASRYMKYRSASSVRRVANCSVALSLLRPRWLAHAVGGPEQRGGSVAPAAHGDIHAAPVEFDQCQFGVAVIDVWLENDQAGLPLTRPIVTYLLVM